MLYRIKILLSFTVVVLFELSVTLTFAQSITINEISYEEWFFSDSDDDYGNGWIELKNSSGLPLNTGSFHLLLNDKSPWPLPELEIPPNEYLFVWLSSKNRNESKNDLHASFSITENHNIFKIVDTLSRQTLDSVIVSSRPYWNESRSRYPESSDQWYNSKQVTAGYANASFGLWRRISSFSQFTPRDSSPNASLYFNNSFWILEGWEGGGGESAAISNVWTSKNGSDWTLVNASPPYHPYSAYVVFQDNMWAFDGSAFKSADGVTWSKVANDLPFTTNSRIVSFDGVLLAVNGRSIYRSIDGINWTTVTNAAPWEYREFPALLVFRDKVWLYGGAINYFTGLDHYYNDVWSSEDGITWVKEVYETEWDGRLWFGYAVFDNKMWMLGGWNYYDKDDVYYGNKNDVWFTNDGITWERLMSANQWQPRHAPLVWSTPTKLYLSSGYLNNYGLFNDVWCIGPLNLSNTNTFYLKKNANPKFSGSWGTNKDGSGLGPLGFDFDYQKFNLTNNDTVVLRNNWAVNGKESRIVVGNGNQSIHIEQKPGVDIVGNVELSSKATLHVMGYESPTIVKAAEDSKVIIHGKNPTKLDADELGHLSILEAPVELLQPTFVKGSVAFYDSAYLTSNLNTLHYSDSASLLYRINADRNSTAVEWPYFDSPGHVIIDCGCTISRNGNATTDTLTFKSGVFEIQNGTFVTQKVLGFSDTTFIVTGVNGYIKMPVNHNNTLFPIGTSNSYNPISLRIKKNNFSSEKFITASTFYLDTLKYQDYAVNVGWYLAEENLQQSAVEYELKAQWNKVNEGSYFSVSDLSLRKYRNGNWFNEGVIHLNPNAQSDSLYIQATLSSLGLFSIQDFRVGLIGIFSFFPNPASDYINVSLPDPPKKEVKISLINAEGKIVFTSALEPDRNVYSIPLARSVPAGIYIVRMVVDQKMYSTKIIKQNAK